LGGRKNPLRDIKTAKRIVVKVGTSTLTHETGKSNLRRMRQLAAVLCDLANAGREVALVSSGAIATGYGALGLARPATADIKTKQAVAAVGQCELMFLYDKFFGEYGRAVGQLLLTREDVDVPQRRDNLTNTFDALFSMGVVPIVNENDSLSTDEIELGGNFGDNDTLSATVAKLVNADALILLTDTDGVFTADPILHPDATLVPVIPEVTAEILAYGGGAGTRRGTGGMRTKLLACKQATEAGIDAVICNGQNPETLYALFDGRQIGTFFRRRQVIA
jgi:glutamate 5-kinase